MLLVYYFDQEQKLEKIRKSIINNNKNALPDSSENLTVFIKRGDGGGSNELCLGLL